jgi:hypothetical protein
MEAPSLSTTSSEHADATGWAAVLILPSVAVLASLCHTASLMTDRMSIRIAANSDDPAYHPTAPRFVACFLAIDGGRTTVLFLQCQCAAFPVPLSEVAEDSRRVRSSAAYCSLTNDPSLLLDSSEGTDTPQAAPPSASGSYTFRSRRMLAINLQPAHLLAAARMLERCGSERPGYVGDMPVRLCVARDGTFVAVDSPFLGDLRTAKLRVLHDVGDPVKFVPWNSYRAAAGFSLTSVQRLRRLLESSTAVARTAELVVCHTRSVSVGVSGTDKREELMASMESVDRRPQDEDGAVLGEDRLARCNVVQLSLAAVLSVAEAVLRCALRDGVVDRCTIAPEIDLLKGTLGVTASAEWVRLDAILLGLV